MVPIIGFFTSLSILNEAGFLTLSISRIDFSGDIFIYYQNAISVYPEDTFL